MVRFRTRNRKNLLLLQEVSLREAERSVPFRICARMRPENDGISHGPVSCPRTPDCPAWRRGRPFDPNTIHHEKNLLQMQEVSLMVTRTGIEPMLPP